MSEREKLLGELAKNNNKLKIIDKALAEARSDLRSFKRQKHLYHADVYENEVVFYANSIRSLTIDKKATNREILNIQRALSEINQQNKKDWNMRFVEAAYEYLPKEQFDDIKRLVGEGAS